MQDGFKPASAWVGHGVAWLEDMQQFYRERSAIEKEYSAKLSALAKKYFEKKNRKMAPLSVGDTPAMTPGSLERLGASGHLRLLSGKLTIPFLVPPLPPGLHSSPPSNPAPPSTIDSETTSSPRWQSR